ncbi:tetratricopeptide repeat protein [Planctomicrobium sp. SH527]|uniref:tetratricopeptide repeat protein n=1 Tax=Planctomicrobium sp. SH527 TaxID=3448123 RepID=UPI003F5B345D
MTSGSNQTEVPAQGTGFALPFRRLLLVLTAAICMAGGMAAGIVIQKQIAHDATAAPPEATADSDNSNLHAESADLANEAGPSASASVIAEVAEEAFPAGDQELGEHELGDQRVAGQSMSDNAINDGLMEMKDDPLPEMAASRKNESSPESMNQHAPSPQAPTLAETPHASPQSPPVQPFKSASTGGSAEHKAVPPDLVSPFRSSDESVLEEADFAFQAENFRKAREGYLREFYTTTNSSDSLLILKIALCEEMLGNLRGAQSAYRKLLEVATHPAIRVAGFQGQARIWTASGRSELATASLFRVLLEGTYTGTDKSMLHQLAWLTSARVKLPSVTGIAADPFLRDELFLSPNLELRPRHLIQTLNQILSVPESNSPKVRPGVNIVRKTGMTPDDIVISFRFDRTNLDHVLNRVSQATGIPIRAATETPAQLGTSTLEPHCVDLPLSVALDALLEPVECIWTWQESGVEVIPAKIANVNQISEYRRQAATRLLQLAIGSAPKHMDSVASQIELARLQAMFGDTVSASIALQNVIERTSRSPYLSNAWFNLAKLYLSQGRPRDSSTAFYRAADMMGGETLECVCYLYAGRIHLEADDPRAATTPLTRAVSLSIGTRHEALISLQLASAYLMLNHFQRANSILMDHRIVLEAPAVRDQAAFLSSLAHYRSTIDDNERFRAGTNVIATMTNLDMKQCFGGHWSWLIGTTYRDTGMTSASIQTFQNCLISSYPFPLQNKMRSALLSDAPELLSKLPSGKHAVADVQTPESFHIDSLLVEAQSAYRQSRFDDAIQLCRDILNQKASQPDQHRRALKLMGQSYQSQGKYEESVQCFTGVVPEAAPAQPATSAGLIQGGVR